MYSTGNYYIKMVILQVLHKNTAVDCHINYRAHVKFHDVKCVIKFIGGRNINNYKFINFTVVTFVY